MVLMDTSAQGYDAIEAVTGLSKVVELRAAKS